MFSIILLYKEINESIYNINSLELFLNIRNIIFVWTFLMLLIAEFCFETKIDGLLLLFIYYSLI